MADVKVILARNMKAARERLGYSQAKLADLAGVSTPFIGEIEIGRKSPSLENVANIAEALDMEIYQLFLEEEPEALVDRQVLLTKLRKELEGKLVEDIEAVFKKYRK